MQALTVPKIESIHDFSSMDVISLHLDQKSKHKLSFSPWREYPYRPSVSFSILYGKDCLYLKFYVFEKYLKATYLNHNDPVSNDSCVEFFISFQNEDEYYNFEFNCIGTSKCGYGNSRKERRYFLPQVINKIEKKSIVSVGTNNGQEWELMLKLPLPVFCFHDFQSFEGIYGKANFYKCGDHLPEPHYLAWNNIHSDKPDFHLSNYFGKIFFE